jgi:hypothetical protein
MEIVASSVCTDRLMRTTQKPARSAVVVLEMRALGAKLPDAELRNPDTLV